MVSIHNAKSLGRGGDPGGFLKTLYHVDTNISYLLIRYIKSQNVISITKVLISILILFWSQLAGHRHTGQVAFLGLP